MTNRSMQERKSPNNANNSKHESLSMQAKSKHGQLHDKSKDTYLINLASISSCTEETLYEFRIKYITSYLFKMHEHSKDFLAIA